jgi:transposase
MGRAGEEVIATTEEGDEMARGDLSGRDWRRLAPWLPRGEGRGRPWCDHRRVINGIRWVLRTGAPWRDLPARYGPWQTCYDRFARWQRDGTWDRLLQALQGEADEAGRLDWEVSVDASVVRAHQHAAGGSRRAAKGGAPSRLTTPWGAAAAAGRASCA